MAAGLEAGDEDGRLLPRHRHLVQNLLADAYESSGKSRPVNVLDPLQWPAGWLQSIVGTVAPPRSMSAHDDGSRFMWGSTIQTRANQGASRTAWELQHHGRAATRDRRHVGGH